MSAVRLYHRSHKMRYTDLQLLQLWTEAFIKVIVQSTKKMPYSMRYLARETLSCLRVCVILSFSAYILNPSRSDFLIYPMKFTELVLRDWCSTDT